MTWLVDNWALIVCALCMITLTMSRANGFIKIPTNEQIKKVKEWLLYAVLLAEKEFDSGTGQMKLRYVYDLFIDKFSFAEIFSFEQFSKLVDEVLVDMKEMLENNKQVAKFVESGE